MTEILARLAPLDEAWFRAINRGLHEWSREAPWVESFLRFTNEFGSAWVLVAIFVGILAFSPNAREGFRRTAELGLGALLGGFGANRLKGVFERPRPRFGVSSGFADGEVFFGFGESYRSFSFPSGHSALAFSVAAVLIWWATDIPDPRRRAIVRAASLLGAALTGLSRIYAGSHYPADVLAGAGLGLLGGGVVVAASRRLLGPYPPRT